MSYAHVVMFLAGAVPFLVAWDSGPLVGLFKQLIALLLWGCVVLIVGWRPSATSLRQPWALTLVAMIMILALLAFGQSLQFSGLPEYGLTSLGILLASVLVFLAASRCAEDRDSAGLMGALLAGVLFAGLANSLVAVVQVYFADWVDDFWVAAGSVSGRSNGNMRQPNHLAMSLLWAFVSILVFVRTEKFTLKMAAVPLLVLSVGLVLSASRMTLVAALVLGCLGAIKSAKMARVRYVLLGLPLCLLMAWAFLTGLAPLLNADVTLTSRIAEGASTSSRWQLWVETWNMILENPWRGVGWGEFNFAWTLSPKLGQHFHHFTHAHNLPLHLAAELGIPLSILICGILIYAFYGAVTNLKTSDEKIFVLRQASLLILLMMFMHSLIEYPFWYAHFLLPVAWFFGFCANRTAVERNESGRGLSAAGAVMIMTACLVAVDYQKIARLSPPQMNASAYAWMTSLRKAQSSLLFSWVAFRQQSITTLKPDGETLPAIEYAAHGFLDSDLLVSWAQALESVGERDKAIFLAQRIAEFSDTEAKKFMRPCSLSDGGRVHWQCEKAKGIYGYGDFR